MHRVSRRLTAVEEDAVNWLPKAGMTQLDAHRDGQIRQWCTRRRGSLRRSALLDEELAVAEPSDVARRPAAEGRKPLPRHGRERLRVSPLLARTGRTVARASTRVRAAPPLSGAQPIGVRARPPDALTGDPGRPSTSPTASTVKGSYRFRRGKRRAMSSEAPPVCSGKVDSKGGGCGDGSTFLAERYQRHHSVRRDRTVPSGLRRSLRPAGGVRGRRLAVLTSERSSTC